MVSFTPQPLYPQGKSTWYPLDKGWVGSRAVLDAVVTRKIPSPRQESNPRTPIVQPVAQRYTDRAITALEIFCKISNMDILQGRVPFTESRVKLADLLLGLCMSIKLITSPWLGMFGAS
jgi:hypothetical protein